MQKLNSTVKLKGVLVSTTDQNLAVKLGRVVSLKRLLKDKRARYEIDGGHVVIVSGCELYELA